MRWEPSLISADIPSEMPIYVILNGLFLTVPGHFSFQGYIPRTVIPACLYSLCPLPFAQLLKPFVLRSVSWGLYLFLL